MRSQDKERFERWKSYLLDFATGAALLLAAAVSFSAPLLCRLISTARNLRGWIMFSASIFGRFPLLPKGPLRNTILIAEGKSWFITKSAILSMFVGVGLSMWLTATQGVLGAAIATVGIYAVSSYLTVLCLWRRNPMAAANCGVSHSLHFLEIHPNAQNLQGLANTERIIGG